MELKFVSVFLESHDHCPMIIYVFVYIDIFLYYEITQYSTITVESSLKCIDIQQITFKSNFVTIIISKLGINSPKAYYNYT